MFSITFSIIIIVGLALVAYGLYTDSSENFLALGEMLFGFALIVLGGVAFALQWLFRTYG